MKIRRFLPARPTARLRRVVGLASLLIALGTISCNSTPVAKAEEKPKPEEPGKEFAEVIKDCKVIPGLFTIYHNPKDGAAYLEILPDRLDKIFLCSITRESGDSQFFDSAALEDDYPFFFKKVNNRIQFILKNVLFRADKDKPVFRAIERGVSDSLIASSIIISKPHTSTGAVLVSLGDFFLIDRQNITNSLNERSKADYGFNKEDSYFSVLKSFPKNTDIEVTLNFRCNKPVPSATSADARSIFLRYYYSILCLPEDNYIPRLADDRVGHFITMFQDYSSMKPETPYVRYIQRWHLEKADPTLPLSPPKVPIVFWLEKTIPLEYRDSIKRGVLLWNKAFEKIGFKDAIVVNQQPDDADWDPADARYHTIRWMVNPGAGYAVGPSQADPFTGELYNADIRISADMTRFFYSQFENYINPLQSQTASTKYCNYAEGLRRQAAFGWSLLEARGFLEGKEAEAEKFVQDYLVDLTVHEVGHTLGLRHNFKASSIRTFEQLNDKAFTSVHALAGSVMDYMPVNLARDPAQQGEYWNSTIGPYDYWAIEYAYKPLGGKTPEEELPQLKEIAARSSDPELAYGTDEDAWGNSPRGIDPACTLFDLGNDPITYCQTRIALAQELWGKIEAKFTKPGESYNKMRQVFAQGLGEYHGVAGILVRYIGGIYHRRDHIGAGETPPLEPVATAQQKAALDFIINNIFTISETSLPPAQLLNKLAPEMMPDFVNSLETAPSLEVQVHNRILELQKGVLNYLYHPLLLTRLNDQSLRLKKDENPFGLAEVFTTLRTSIWSELAKAQNIDSFRRNLQRAHAEKLIALIRTPPEGLPDDALALARADLVTIRDAIAQILPTAGQLDTYTKAHLEDINSRITATLEWKGK